MGKYSDIIKFFLLFNLALLLLCDVSFCTEPRLTVCVFKYAGSNTTITGNNFNVFRKIYQDKIDIIKDELSIISPDHSYIDGLSMFPPLSIEALSDSLSKEKDVKNYWENSNALQLLRGIIFIKEDTIYVRSKVYLGPPSNSLKISSIITILPLTFEEFPNTYDTHSLVTYYALAMDAERLGRKSAFISLVSAANNTIKNIEQRGNINKSLLPLKDSIKAVYDRHKKSKIH